MNHLCAAVAFSALASSSVLAQSTTYAFDLRGDDSLFSFPVDDPTSQTQISTIGGLTYATYAMDFSTSGDTLYAVNHLNAALEIGTIDLGDGTWTLNGTIPDPAPIVTGLTMDPTDETLYLSNADFLWQIDPSNGATGLVGEIFGFDPGGLPIGLVIDIAIDNNGQMYAHDISNDALWSVDKTTGDATFIGNTGLAANFAQGMDFDPATNTLYAAIYTGGGTGSYCTWDTTTGAITEILDLPSFPNAEVELEIAIRPNAAPCLADWNGDGIVNTSDFLDFLNDYNSVRGGGSFIYHDPDLAPPVGVINTADFLAFLNLYNAGC